MLEVDGARALLGVFDGMGGAGGATYDLGNGETASGARLASTTASEVVKREYASGAFFGEREPQGVAERLVTALRKELTLLRDRLGPTGSRVRSVMLREFPTTLALASLTLTHEPAVLGVDVLWAGDSRVFSWTPELGLMQLSRDHLKGDQDALANLRGDSQMTNCVSIDREFFISASRVFVPLPAVVLCATDGCFAYLRTPMHFEHLLLRALEDAANEEEWGHLIAASLKGVTGDDASMALAAVAARSRWTFDDLQNVARKRCRDLSRSFVGPVNMLEQKVGITERRLAESRDAYRAAIADGWDRYRETYERYLPEGPEQSPRAEP